MELTSSVALACSPPLWLQPHENGRTVLLGSFLELNFAGIDVENEGSIMLSLMFVSGCFWCFCGICSRMRVSMGVVQQQWTMMP